ncbi:phosphatase PAP2 family protein [Flavobacterium sp.]|uniref:phosphatase PAP2 family protein n=1 Tax=Flavobacterium sp. TaxID=239 RepID=UPI003BCB17A7
MKSLLLLLLLIIPLSILAQVDSLQTKVDSLQTKKEKRFHVAGSILKNSILSVPGDFSEMGHTFSSDWKRTAIYSGSILGLIATDKITTGYLHEHIEPTIDYQLPKIGIFKTKVGWIDGDNAYILCPIIGLYAGSLIANREKGQVVAVNAIKSISYSYIISHLFLKTLTARNRPQRPINDDRQAVEPWTKNPWDFGNYQKVEFRAGPRGGTSFPSFHTTFYFSVAKVFQMEYNNYWIPYTIVTGVWLSNIKGHDHWVSDILLGGLVGTIIGKSVVNSSRKQMAKNNLSAYNYNPKKFKMTKQLVPQISSSMVGFHFSGTF